jgi:hypothetical protein
MNQTVADFPANQGFTQGFQGLLFERAVGGDAFELGKNQLPSKKIFHRSANAVYLSTAVVMKGSGLPKVNIAIEEPEGAKLRRIEFRFFYLYSAIAPQQEQSCPKAIAMPRFTFKSP